MKQIHGFLVVAFSFLVVLASSCSNKNSSVNQKAHIEVRLTDDPLNVDAVYIDVQDVQINVTGDGDEGWQSLTGVNKGVYNLLDLVNDKDTLLADAEIPSGKLHQLRLVLGSNNSIVVDGINVPLETPSAEQSGLKLNIQQNVQAGILYTILLDFDAGKSIVHTGSDKYILKPVIRTILQAVGGSITGNVQPDSVKTIIYAIQGSDTAASTFTDANGGYLIKALTAGSYDLHFWPMDTTFLPAVRTGVSVSDGNLTVVDTVHLTQ